MKILLIGGDGMLGHRLLQGLHSEHEVKATVKFDNNDCINNKYFNEKNIFYGVNVLDDYTLLKVILDYRPEVIINASGIIKYRPNAEDKVLSLKVNALLPQRLAMLCGSLGCKLIHFSTDCVFTGEKGNYKETDKPDSTDVYGLTKYAGEIKDDPCCLTLRTSFYGLELKYFTGLVEWFLNAKGVISGYTHAMYTGLSTAEVTRVISVILSKHSDMHGLYHLSGSSINKFNLLSKLKSLLNKNDIEIQPDEKVKIDRSLNSDLFRNAIGYQPPSWDDMLGELSEEVITRGKI